MSERSKRIYGGFFLLTMIGISVYVGVFSKSELMRNGVITTAITYDTYLLGNGGTLRYFFKTPEGIYTGTTSTLSLKAPGYYYKLKYSSNDPTISELYRDSLVPDSIGRQIIRLDEINKFNVVNADQVLSWQWK